MADPVLLVEWGVIGASLAVIAYRLPRYPSIWRWRLRRWIRAQRPGRHP